MRTFFAITLSTVAVPVLRIPLLARGWQLFAQRLARAQKILHDVRDWQPKCPMWWLVYMQVALGQGWSRSDYENIFTEAKAFEPQCWDYDVARALCASRQRPAWLLQEHFPGKYRVVAENMRGF